jgi:hypothetical protein
MSIMTADKDQGREQGSRRSPLHRQQALVDFLRQPAEETPDGKPRFKFFVGGELLFILPHEPSECQEVGANEFFLYYTDALQAVCSGADSGNDLAGIFLYIFRSVNKIDTNKRDAFMVRAIAMTTALFESDEVANYIRTRPAGAATDALVFAGSQAPVQNNFKFNHDRLFEIADERLQETSGEYRTERILAALAEVNPGADPIIQRDGEAADELVARMACPELYRTPLGYKPPARALELLARYEAGERYFVETELTDASPGKVEVSLKEAELRGVNLNRSKLIHLDMRSCDLSDAHIIASDLSQSNLSSSKCPRIRLMGTTLRLTDFGYAILADAQMRNTDLQGANLTHANLRNAFLSEADLSGADLSYADVTNAGFEGANLDNANLRDVKGTLWLDNNSVKGTQFSFNARDPWSVLCRQYTGINLVYHLTFLFLFVLAQAVNVVYLVLVGKGQQMGVAVVERVESLSWGKSLWFGILDEYLTAEVPRNSVLEVASGFARGYGVFAVTVLLTTYNIGRWYLTKQVNLTKADQDRNNRWPKLSEYKKFFQIHQIVRLLMYFSLAIFLAHVYSWLTTPVALH